MTSKWSDSDLEGMAKRVAAAPTLTAGYEDAAAWAGTTATAVRLLRERGTLVLPGEGGSVAAELAGRIHVVIGDTQVKPGVPTDHLTWIGRYIVDRFAGRDIVVCHVGDHWDMPSLSSYDKGKREMEGRRYKADVRAGNEAFARLSKPWEDYNARRLVEGLGPWSFERHFFMGNHEDRITRACDADAQLDGVLSLDDLDTRDWTVHPFLATTTIDGVTYSHYFYNPNTGRPYCGENLHLRLKTIGHTFTMGHQQGINHAIRPVGATTHHGLVVGSTYLHDEKYLGPQGNRNWRGIVVCHQVEAGAYDPMFVSLDYLCRRYERKTLAAFMAEREAA